MKKVYGILSVCLFIGIAIGGCIGEDGGMVIIPSVEAGSSGNPKYAFTSFYSLDGITIEGQAPQYTLPLNVEGIENWGEISQYFTLTDEQLALLKSNGFVVIDYGEVDDITVPYMDMKNRDIPIFVTSDTLLHLYHIQFNELLKTIEEREFYGYLVDMSRVMLEQAKDDYKAFTDYLLKEASRRNVAFFCVALSLLGEDVEIPDYVEDEVGSEVESIENHAGFEYSEIFHYKEDYSQYVPRGHYTQSETLEKYFMAMMWYGRISFLLKGGEPYCRYCDYLISEEDSNIATIQASLISAELTSMNMNGVTAFDVWKRMYAITSFFVGVADDLTPYEYLDCLGEVFGAEINISSLSNETILLNLKAELAQLRNPQIYGGTGDCVILPPFTKEKLYEVLDKTKGMRFMGQRYVPDSYMFQQLVSPAVGVYVGDRYGDDKPFTMEITMGGAMRCFPRGLDIMAVLGSERALEILEADGDTEYEGENTSYYSQLDMLRELFNAMNVTEWNRNLYWGWLYALKALLKDFDSMYPTFMQTEAWKDKELQTTLASWTELRHDTILYAKQSYTPVFSGVPPPVNGYVEPVPEFYARMKALVNMTREGLMNFSVINSTEEERLVKLGNILERLIELSVKELKGEELDEADGHFLRYFVDEINETTTGMNKEAKETTLIADVHTDANTIQCLEEGVGYVDLALVAFKTGGEVYLGGGSVFSYYEFKQPMENRLTNEEWKDILKTSPPAPQSWISSFIA